MAPPVMANALWLNLKDVDEHQSAGMWTLQDQSQLVSTPYDALISATQALSCMGVFAAMKQQRKSIANTPVTGPYCTFRDQAVFNVQSANASGSLVIPGPIASIFASDGNAINLSDPLVQAWWTEVQAILGDNVGSPWIFLKNGYRAMVPEFR